MAKRVCLTSPLAFMPLVMVVSRVPARVALGLFAPFFAFLGL